MGFKEEGTGAIAELPRTHSASIRPWVPAIRKEGGREAGRQRREREGQRKEGTRRERAENELS